MANGEDEDSRVYQALALPNVKEVVEAAKSVSYVS